MFQLSGLCRSDRIISMGRNKYFKPALTIGQQFAAMALVWRCFKGHLSRNSAEWIGCVRSTNIGTEYRIRIEYVPPKRPRVFVLSPSLQLLPGARRIPHTFSDGSLCLNMPEEWRPDLRIAAWIVPWISVWLFFYEMWHATGDWLGGGHEPAGK